MLEQLKSLDHIRLNFSEGGLLFLNIAIGFLMFSVALGIKTSHFSNLVSHPKPFIIGIISQFIILPAITFALVWSGRFFLTPAIAFGMILVAACPGGNISNFISSLAKANVALAVSLTAVGTILAIFMTPFNFITWGKLYSATSPYIKNFPAHLDPVEMFKTVFIILGIPVLAGITASHYLPGITGKIIKPVKNLSLAVFVSVLILLFYNNFEFFIKYIKWIFLIVLIQNAMALFTGYLLPAVFRLPRIERRTISIETGIHNTALGIALIFNPKIFPAVSEIGGMAFIVAWWGIWHILSGLGLALLWSKIRTDKKL